MKQNDAVTFQARHACLFAALLTAALFASTGYHAPSIWTERVVTPSAINQEGSALNTRATVTLTAFASGDSAVIGAPLDIVFATGDNPKIQSRLPGDRNLISPNRIQGAYNASVSFTDSFLIVDSRAALFNFSGTVDTAFPYQSNTARIKGLLDSNLLGNALDQGNAMWRAINLAILYAKDHMRPGAQVGLITLTTGNDNGSYKQSPGPGILGRTEVDAVDSLLRTLSAARQAGLRIKIFIVGVGNGVKDNDGYMTRVADSGGGIYAWTYDGLGLDSIFNFIGHKLVDVVAIRWQPGAPMLTDILAPGVHYVPGSYVPNLIGGSIAPQFIVDTVAGLTRLRFGLDTIRLGEFMEVSYQVTVAAGPQDTLPFVLKRLTNTAAYDPVNYSFVKYRTVNDSVVERPIDQGQILLRTGESRLLLSLSPTTYIPVSPTRLIALSASAGSPAVYPETTFYAILEQSSGTLIRYRPVNAIWRFRPPANWTAATLDSVAAASRRVGLSAPYDYPGLCTLKIEYTTFAPTKTLLSDRVVFSVYAAGSPERIVGLYIDDDTTTLAAPARLEFVGTRSELSGVNRWLFARALTDRNRVIPLSARWASPGFTLFGTALSQIFNGVHGSRLFTLTVPAASVPQTDSGWIRIDSAGLTDSLWVRIIDTSLYQVPNYMVLYNNNYGNDSAQIVAHLAEQRSRSVYSLSLTDSVTFRAMLFISNGVTAHFAGAATAQWSLNNGPAVTASAFTLRPGGALSSDRLVVTYVNALNRTLSDTVTVNWGFGTSRFLTIESRPGIPGDTVRARYTGPLLIPANADTLRGLYAVVRDEYGHCVYSGSASTFSEYAVWTLSPAGVSTYVTIPRDTTAECWIFRKADPPSETVFRLVVTGLDFQGLLGRRDSIEVRLTSYTLTALSISASAAARTPIRDLAGHTYAAGEDIPKTALLVLTAQSDTIALQAALQRSDNSAWITQPVEWRLTNAAPVNNVLFPDAQVVELKPSYPVARDTLVASYSLSGGAVLRDTVYFTVGLPWIDTILIIYGDTNVTAGDSFRFTILAIDRNGDTVKITDRLPSGFTLTSDGTLLFVGTGGTQLISDSSVTVTDAFTGGLSSNMLVPWSAGPQQIIIAIPIPTPTGIIWFRDTVTISVSPGLPDSIRVVRLRDNLPALADTLCPVSGNSADTSAGYQILLYDVYGNLIPASNSAYPELRLLLSGSILDSNRITRSNDRFTYNAAGTAGSGNGTVTAILVRGNDTLLYTFSLTIVPIVGVESVVTREWLPDTVNGIAEIEHVLDWVLGIDPDSLWFARRDSGLSRMGVFLDALEDAGYPSVRDGYLDCLDLTFSEPFYLTLPVVTDIHFAPPSLRDTLRWALSGHGRAIGLFPADTLPAGPLHRTWRLFLIPHSLEPGRPPFETGFLPVVTFSNEVIRSRDAGSGIPRLLGGLAPLHTSDPALTADSAAPVLTDFLFQNNACDRGGTPSRIFMGFSEPLVTAPLAPLSSLTGLTLSARARIDSLFIQTSLLNLERSDRVLRETESWAFGNDLLKAMTLVAEIRPESLHHFIPEVSRLRLSLEPGNTRLVDGAGNRACATPSSGVRLGNHAGQTLTICSITGTTVVDRYTAMTLSWTTVNGEPAPGFPFFGFSANLQNLLNEYPRNQPQGPSLMVNGRISIICDFDSDFVMIDSRAQVFDLLGNLAASPTSHPMLASSYTIKEIRTYLGIEPLDALLRSLKPEEVERYFSISRATSIWEPDTLRPIYPPTLTLGYDFLRKNCGPATGRESCLPSWNCLNAKGRLVGPGGYIVSQWMRVGTARAEVSRKILVKSGVVRL